MNSKKLRVIVFTQEDRFFIPTNILKAGKVCEIIEVVNNQSKNSFDNRMTDLIKWFGIAQCGKMGILEIKRIVEGGLDVISGYKLFGGTRSIKHAARRLGATYRTETNINSRDYVDHVKELAPDLVISFSAPQIVKPELLSVPRYSVINVHGALLPNYRGLLPSFWYLYNEEKIGGATVHKMSAAIDDGSIINQDSVDISDCKSMFDLMKKTKLLGGELMVKTIEEYTAGNIHSRTNNIENGSYFTWPTVAQAKDFRKRGMRLV